MVRYDHRVHAGNAGDVWKHFLLLEAVDCFLEPGGSLIYAESHAGRPEYVLRGPGDWEGGIGRILPILPSLRDFSYFDILADLNQKSASIVPGRQPALGSNIASVFRPIIYPGSTRLIYELARRKGANLQANVWDNDAGVAYAWKSFFSAAKSNRSSPPTGIVFHDGDGFEGVKANLSRSCPGLLFIDPAYIYPEDASLAIKLLQRAKNLGWIVLWWYMIDMQTAPDDLQAFELQFSDVGLDGGIWKGAAVTFAGKRNERFDNLIRHINQRRETFIRILKLE